MNKDTKHEIKVIFYCLLLALALTLIELPFHNREGLYFDNFLLSLCMYLFMWEKPKEDE